MLLTSSFLLLLHILLMSRQTDSVATRAYHKHSRQHSPSHPHNLYCKHRSPIGLSPVSGSDLFCRPILLLFAVCLWVPDSIANHSRASCDQFLIALGWVARISTLLDCGARHAADWDTHVMVRRH